MSYSASSARPAPLGYAGKGQRYDGCVDASGQLREPWAQFFDLLGPDPATALRAADEACHRAIIEQDVSMNVYRGERAGTQLWPLDAMPMLIATGEWASLSRALRQRAHLFNELLLDLYGDQKILREGTLPAALVMANPHFQRACAGLGRRSPGVFLHTYAVDVARAPDGRWWAIEDRLDAPSGLGYSLQNRIITRQALPEVFHRAPVERLYQFFRNYRDSLAGLSPNSGDPRIALLSPGPANETYHEQAYLARYLGYNLVEGEDLITRDGHVYLRTVGGLQRMDVILRRLDSDFCDPLELDSRSLLGVPGLMQSVHAGQVALANQPGAGVLETPALLAFLRPLCRQVLGEELLLPNAATWWCGQEGAQNYVAENLANLVIKPAFRTRDSAPTRYGAWMGKSGRAALADQIRAEPWAWCGQERVFHGTTPGWYKGAQRPMPFVTRFYVSWHDGDYTVYPGGLTRCNPRGEDMIVSLQQGSVSKDTWVLHSGPPSPLPAFLASSPGETLRHPAATPSRMANNLFWLGRYLERASQLARKFEKIDPLLRAQIAPLDPGVPDDALCLIALAQDADPAEPEETLAERITELRRIAEDVGQPSSLAAVMGHLLRLLGQLKLTLPPEGWQLLRQMHQRRVTGEGGDCAWLRQQLSVLESLTDDSMPRDLGWHFLDLGRRLERSQQLLQLFQAMLYSPAAATPTDYRLQSILHFGDSLFTYRHLYHGQLDATGVIDWLLLSAENPRGFLFQAAKIDHDLNQLPADVAPRAAEALRALSARVHSEVRLAEAVQLAGSPAAATARLREWQAALGNLGERLGEIYFTHTAAS